MKLRRGVAVVVAALSVAAVGPQAQRPSTPLAPLELTRPDIPPVTWATWSSPLDRFVSAYLRDRAAGDLSTVALAKAEPRRVGDRVFARRVYLDVWGLLPTRAQLEAFLADNRPTKREALVDALLGDNQKYAEHWISFWNDLLRNEDGVTYFSETAGRKSITDWLLPALANNVRYDEFVRRLLNPASPADPEGFLIGVNWRGETTPAVTPWMQAAQNTAQVFLGVNLKCNACHDSFISDWKLKDAYALAAYFSPDPKLRLYRCEVGQNRYAEPAFLFPRVAHTPASESLADRRAAAAAAFTDPGNGRFSRTLVNRIWHRLLGHGIVANPDEMDGPPWSPQVLDFLASDFVDHGYDVKYLIRTILTSRAYQLPAVTRTAEPAAEGYRFEGPEVRRLTAEQFADAIGVITGEWRVYPGRPATPGGVYAREWRAASTSLTRALGRPVRDQVTSARATQASALQALELVNGEIYTKWLARGARRLLGELPPEPRSLFNAPFVGRSPKAATFDVDVSKASTLWLVVDENGSNTPEKILPAWSGAALDGPGGVMPLSSLKPRDAGGLRSADASGVRVKNPSVLVYDLKPGFTRFRGTIGIENPKSDIGSTLNPQVRFFIFDAAPNLERLLPPAPGTPLPAPPRLTTVGQTIDYVFWSALGRAASPAERRLSERALPTPNAAGLADLLWAIMMKPEFQFIY